MELKGWDAGRPQEEPGLREVSPFWTRFLPRVSCICVCCTSFPLSPPHSSLFPALSLLLVLIVVLYPTLHLCLDQLPLLLWCTREKQASWIYLLQVQPPKFPGKAF